MKGYKFVCTIRCNFFLVLAIKDDVLQIVQLVALAYKSRRIIAKNV